MDTCTGSTESPSKSARIDLQTRGRERPRVNPISRLLDYPRAEHEMNARGRSLGSDRKPHSASTM